MADIKLLMGPLVWCYRVDSWYTLTNGRMLILYPQRPITNRKNDGQKLVPHKVTRFSLRPAQYRYHGREHQVRLIGSVKN